MKYPPRKSDSKGSSREKRELPVFESLDGDGAPSHPPGGLQPSPNFEALDGPSDVETLQEAALTSREPNRPKEMTDFGSLKEYLDAPPSRWQARSATDLLVDSLTPIMIFIMVYSLVFFLLDIRFVFTGLHDKNLRLVAFCFVMGCVAVNRLVASEGSDESFLYVIVFAGAVGFYTLATTNVYGVGSFARGFLDRPWPATGFNMALVAILWWATNRLTHECCVDTNPNAGEIGLMRGAIRGFQTRVKRADKPPEPIFVRKDKGPIFPMNEIEPFDPVEGYKPKPKVSAQIEDPTKRLPKRHPGISIFYFSVPALIIFSLGLRVIQDGKGMVLLGQFYLICFTVAALSLLMLTSLAGVREYFRRRRVHIPGAIGWFWIGLGTVMIALVLLGALKIPRPGLPPILPMTGEREGAVWEDDSRFEQVENTVAATAVQALAASRFMDRVGMAALIILGVFLGYAALRGLGLLAGVLGKRRDYLPRFITVAFEGLDTLLNKITSVPNLPKFKRRVRVSPQVSLSIKYKNPLGASLDKTAIDTRQAIATTYDALCALAEDLGVPRHQDQTPYEFLHAFPKELDSLRKEARELTDLYVRSAYSPQNFDHRVHDRLRKFWVNYDRVRKRIVR